ncbi:MAG TPA: hypothetical protein VIN09_13765 [Chloroflexota bacterium]
MQQLRSFYERHPFLVNWILLSIGMVAILLYSARNVDLQPTQLLAMVVATVGVAALCVWIISWES